MVTYFSYFCTRKGIKTDKNLELYAFGYNLLRNIVFIPENI